MFLKVEDDFFRCLFALRQKQIIWNIFFSSYQNERQQNSARLTWRDIKAAAQEAEKFFFYICNMVHVINKQEQKEFKW